MKEVACNSDRIIENIEVTLHQYDRYKEELMSKVASSQNDNQVLNQENKRLNSMLNAQKNENLQISKSLKELEEKLKLSHDQLFDSEEQKSLLLCEINVLKENTSILETSMLADKEELSEIMAILESFFDERNYDKTEIANKLQFVKSRIKALEMDKETLSQQLEKFFQVERTLLEVNAAYHELQSNYQSLNDKYLESQNNIKVCHH